MQGLNPASRLPHTDFKNPGAVWCAFFLRACIAFPSPFPAPPRLIAFVASHPTPTNSTWVASWLRAGASSGRVSVAPFAPQAAATPPPPPGPLPSAGLTPAAAGASQGSARTRLGGGLPVGAAVPSRYAGGRGLREWPGSVGGLSVSGSVGETSLASEAGGSAAVRCGRGGLAFVEAWEAAPRRLAGRGLPLPPSGPHGHRVYGAASPDGEQATGSSQGELKPAEGERGATDDEPPRVLAADAGIN